MNLSNQITKKIFFILRQLQNENENQSNSNLTTINNNIQKQQLRDLYIYIAILIVIIITILGGYALYRKCSEKKAIQEIEREYQVMIMNLLNSASSQVNSCQEDRKPYSDNNIINPNYIHNFENESGNPNMNNSLEYNYEERMENIRKKFGNSIVIKCLLKKQIEETKFEKSYGEEYGDICTICMENFVDLSLISKTPCEHIFHKKCFDTYLKGVCKKDKLLCPNCNQNLLINKKYLKLRAKTKIEVKKMNKKDLKENGLNSENRNSVITNKNEINIDNNKNEIIFIKKKHKIENKNKIKENSKNIHNLKDKNEDNIYNPLQLNIKKNESNNETFAKSEKDTIMQFSDRRFNENKNEKEKKLRRNVAIINFDSSITNNESKTNLYNKKRKININDINSQKNNIIISKRSRSPILCPLNKEN